MSIGNVDREDTDIPSFDFSAVSKRVELMNLTNSEKWKEIEPTLFDQLQRLGEALSDETRIKIIIELLRNKSLSVSSLSEKIQNVAKKTLYYHYNLLRETQLIYWSRKGRGKKLKRGDILYASDFAVSLVYDVLIPHPYYHIETYELPQEISENETIEIVEDEFSEVLSKLIDEVERNKKAANMIPIIRQFIKQNLLPTRVADKILSILNDEQVRQALIKASEKCDGFCAVFPTDSEKARIWKSIQEKYAGEDEEEVIFNVFKKVLSIET
jgi:DNA-binding transcriptional ArsR family regulator